MSKRNKQQSKRFRRKGKLKHMPRRRYRFRQSMNEDLYGSEAIRTKYEYLFEGFLKEADLPYLVNQVFCFKCNKSFPYENRDVPEHCFYCDAQFKKKSIIHDSKDYLSRPDFIIDLNKENEERQYSKLGIIRIDGDVHAFKSVSIKDYFILKSFKERGIKVFIIKNEVLLAKTVPEIKELVQSIRLMMEDEDLYTKYTKSKEYEELTYCPYIEMKKYNKQQQQQKD